MYVCCVCVSVLIRRQSCAAGVCVRACGIGPFCLAVAGMCTVEAIVLLALRSFLRVGVFLRVFLCVFAVLRSAPF